MQKRKTATEAEGGSGGDDDDLVWIPRKQRKLAKYQEVEGTQQQRSGVEGDKGEDQDKFLSREQQQQQPQQSLLSETTALINKNGGLVMDEETRQKIEETEEMEKALDEYVPLKSRAELASGVTYTGPIETGWRPPRRIRALTPEQVQKMREKWYIQVSGEDIPPPVRRFEDMRLPKCLVEHLHNKGINRPTPIQMQGFPAALSGRDVIGIAYTGSGKTITFAIPMIIRSMCEELKLTISNNEGPIGLILCPSVKSNKQQQQQQQQKKTLTQHCLFICD